MIAKTKNTAVSPFLGAEAARQRTQLEKTKPSAPPVGSKAAEGDFSPLVMDFVAALRGAQPTETEKLRNSIKGLVSEIKGLTAAIKSATTQPEKWKASLDRGETIMSTLYEALPHPSVLGLVDETTLGELTSALESFAKVAPAFIKEVTEAIPEEPESKKEAELAGKLGFVASNLEGLLFFSDAATRPSPTAGKALQSADEVGGGVMDTLAAFALAGSIDQIATESGISHKDVAKALKWYVGHMTEIGFHDSNRFYQELSDQKAGQPSKFGPPIHPERVGGLAMRAAEIASKAVEVLSPTNYEQLQAALNGSIEVKDSAKYPLLVAMVPTETPGDLSLTLAPGKQQPSLYGFVWERDLKADLSTLQDKYGVNTLVPLIEKWEYEALGIADYNKQAKAHGMKVRALEIMDQHTPNFQEVDKLADKIVDDLKAGKNVLVHCKGGLGRAGTVTAVAMIKLGVPWDLAVGQIREARPGAIENEHQMKFVQAFAEEYLPAQQA